VLTRERRERSVPRDIVARRYQITFDFCLQVIESVRGDEVAFVQTSRVLANGRRRRRSRFSGGTTSVNSLARKSLALPKSRPFRRRRDNRSG
jgi:hypothetical protein